MPKHMMSDRMSKSMYDQMGMKGYKVVGGASSSPKASTPPSGPKKRKGHTLGSLRKKTKGDPDAMLREFGF